jgi:predicted NBD/HSP70 family sugar kinase
VVTHKGEKKMNKLVFDVGGTFVKYAIMDNEANILEKGNYPTPMKDRPDFVSSLVDVFEKYQDQVDGIAMSLPGCLDSTTGYIYTPGSLRYNTGAYITDEIAAEVKNRLGRDIHVSVENDGKSAALAEVWKGNLADVDDGAVLILGTGLGGGIIHDRKVYKGKNFFAGELSFLMTDILQDGWENVAAHHASTTGLISKTAKYTGLKEEEIDGFKVFELINAGDENAIRALNEMSQALAGIIYNLVCTMNPQKVLIGGGISKQPLVLETVSKKANEAFDKIAAIGMEMPRPAIDVCKHFNDSNMIGALYNYKLLYED